MGFEAFVVKQLKNEELDHFNSVKEMLRGVGVELSYRELDPEAEREKPTCFLSFSWDDQELHERQTRNAGGRRVNHTCWGEYDKLVAAGKKKTEICKKLGIKRTTLYRRLRERKALQEANRNELLPYDDSEMRI